MTTEPAALLETLTTSDSRLFTAIAQESIAALNPVAPITLTTEATVLESVRLMQNKRIGAVLITEAGQLAGIFTERDALFKVLGSDLDIATTQVQDLMTRDPESLTREDSIIYAINRMTVGGYRHIPIVEADGQLTGIISIKDIVEYLVGLIEGEVFAAGL
jgi:CBS domain-containing protein